MKQHHTSVHTVSLARYACPLCEERHETDAKLTKHMTDTLSFLYSSVQILKGLPRLLTFNLQVLDPNVYVISLFS